MKKGLSILFSILLLFALAACNGGGNDSAGSNTENNENAGNESDSAGDDVIKIGGIFSASGGAAPLGKPEMNTVQMLADQINENGGINGKKIEVISYDDKSDQNEAVLTMKKLLDQEKVDVVVGGTTSGNSMAMLPLAMKAKVPFISIAASKEINNPSDGSSREYIFKTAQGDDVVIPKVAAFLKEQGLTKVAWLNVANSYGTSGHEEFLKVAEENGIEIVAEEEFEATVTDAKAMLTRVKKADPQAIIVWGTVQESAVVTKNIRQLGMDQMIINSHGIGNKQFIELAGDAAEGVVFPAGKLLVVDQLPADDPQKEVLSTYKEQYESTFNSPASTFGGHAWDAFQLVVKAIEDGATDSQSIRDSIEATQNFVGISGIFNMSPENHNGLSSESLVMIEIKDGDWTLYNK